jgi:hypothetical protein
MNLIQIALYPILFVLGFLVNEILLRRNKMLYQFIRAVKKRNPIAFLETDKMVYFVPIERFFKNLGLTKTKEVVIVPKGSVKPSNLGVEMAHGDLYKSITTPQEFRILCYDLLNSGWSADDIASFFEKVEQIPAEELKQKYISKINDLNEKLKKINLQIVKEEKPEILEELNKKVMEIDTELKKQFKEFNLFLNLPSTIKDFIYTGVNRVSLSAMIREMVYQRELERLGQRNWVAIGIAVLLILIGLALFGRFILPMLQGGGASVTAKIP